MGGVKPPLHPSTSLRTSKPRQERAKRRRYRGRSKQRPYIRMTRPKANPRSQKPHVQNRRMGHPARKVSGRGTTGRKTPRVKPTRGAPHTRIRLPASRPGQPEGISIKRDLDKADLVALGSRQDDFNLVPRHRFKGVSKGNLLVLNRLLPFVVGNCVKI